MRKLATIVWVTTAIGALSPALRAEGLLAEIKQRGEVTAATEAQFPPFEFVKDGKIVDYHKDILDEIAAEMGVKANQLDLSFQGILSGLAAKKFDFVATSIGYNKERAERYAFTAPVAVFETGILARGSDDLIRPGVSFRQGSGHPSSVRHSSRCSPGSTPISKTRACRR